MANVLTLSPCTPAQKGAACLGGPNHLWIAHASGRAALQDAYPPVKLCPGLVALLKCDLERIRVKGLGLLKLESLKMQRTFGNCQ